MVDIVEYGVEYGDCAGYCSSTLRFSDTSSIELFQVSRNAEEPPRCFSGTLEPALRDAISQELERIVPLIPGHVYGDPDAADEGAVTVVVSDGHLANAHVYSRGAPPPDLAALDGLLGPILWGWLDGAPVDGLRYEESPRD